MAISPEISRSIMTPERKTAISKGTQPVLSETSFSSPFLDR